MYESSLAIGTRLRDHPSVLDFSWSDNQPINEQESASLAGFSQSGFQEPIISSAEYNTSGILGPSGEKEGPYDWVPPGYWYDTTHSSNNANDNDSTLTNVGGSWGFDSEQGSGDTVPTMDSIQRFLSPSDQAALWQQPDAHQFHTNYESTDGSHSGYSFGTLDNLDTAVQNRYGSWSSLSQYDLEAQVQNYEDTRAQFEAFIDHWNNGPTPATGTVYWQLNKGWPTLLWDLYNADYDEAGAYFGAKKANEDLHVLYAYDTGGVTVDNLTGASQDGLSVESRVYDSTGKLLDRQSTAHPLALESQQVASGVLSPRVPSATTPPTPAKTYFVEVILRQDGQVVDRNVYWLSTQPDVIDWNSTEGNPQADNGAPLTQYADMTALQGLPSEPVQVAASTTTGSTTAGNGGADVTSVTITNPSSNPAVAFFVRADVRRGDASGTALSGDNEVLPITWSDNDITLWPGESETLTATYRSSLLAGASPVVSINGWNIPNGVFTAAKSAAAVSAERVAQSAPGVQHFGAAAGIPADGTTVPAGPVVSAAPGGPSVSKHRGRPVDDHLGRPLAGRHPGDQLQAGRQRRHLLADRDEFRQVADRRHHPGHAHRHRRPEHHHGLHRRPRLDLRHLQRPDRGLHRDRRAGRQAGRPATRAVLPAGHADRPGAARDRLRHPGLDRRAARDQRRHRGRRLAGPAVGLDRDPDADRRGAWPHRGQRGGRGVPEGRDRPVRDHGHQHRRRADERLRPGHRDDHRAARGRQHPGAVRERLDVQPRRDHVPAGRARGHLLPR